MGVGLEGEIRSELNASGEERDLKRKVDSVSSQDMIIQRQRK